MAADGEADQEERVLGRSYKMEDAKRSQKVKILKHMEEKGSITPWEAIKEYNCTRLSARIADLKKDGYAIESEIVYSKNIYGEPVHYAKYRLEDVR